MRLDWQRKQQTRPISFLAMAVPVAAAASLMACSLPISGLQTPSEAPPEGAPPSAVRPVTAPPPRVAPSAPPQSCLAVERRNGVYWLNNAQCSGQKVLAVVEIRLNSGVLKCRGHVVTGSTKLGTTQPALNYECIQGTADCSPQSVKAIFPYCAW